MTPSKPVRFMRIPFPVTGRLVTDDNMEEIAEWCGGDVVQNKVRPFVLVPVNRSTHKNQTEGYAGTWVILSIQRGKPSFKVYTEEWLRKQFFVVPDDSMTDEDGFPLSEREIVTNRPSGDPRSIPSQIRPATNITSIAS